MPTLTSGLVIGMLDVALAISFAALIFAGPLAAFVPQGIGYALAGFLIINVIITLFTSWPGFVGGSQSAPAAIMAVMSAAIAASMPPSATAGETFMTVITAIAASALATGLFFLGTGFFEVGGLVRFLPYPVVGGFLAGTGWLLISGAVSLMADLPVDLAQLPSLLQLDVVVHWLPGVLLAIVTMILLRYVDHYLVLPGTLLLALLLFFAFAWVSGLTLADLSAGGWLLGPFADEGLWQPLTLASLTDVYWPAVANQAAGIASIVLISTVSLLLNAGGLELEVDCDIDLNKELRVAGLANSLASLSAGLVGYQQISFSVLNHKIGADNRLTGLVAAALCSLVLLAGASFLGFFPKVVIGSLLFLLGFSLIVEWVISGWSKLPRIDFAIVLTILLVTALVGFLQAVALGVLLAVILFVVGYSQVNVVRYELSAASYRSRVVRSREEAHLLRKHGREIYLLQLQGFIFFGTADSLLNQVRRRMYDEHLPPLAALVLDFEHVTGLDSTAMISFGMIKSLAQRRQFPLVLCATNNRVRKQLESGSLHEMEGAVAYFASVDHGVAWCEQKLLERLTAGPQKEREGIETSLPLIARQIARILAAGRGSHAAPEELYALILTMVSYFEKWHVAAGAQLIGQGEPADELYFLAAGQVTARLKTPDGKFLRLETVGSGWIIGEIGFYLGQERTADVVADVPSTLFRLSRDNQARMQQEAPEASSLLHHLIAQLLAERVSRLTDSVRALER